MKKGGKSWELTLCLWICREKKTFVRQLLVNCPSPASVFPKLGQFGTASHWLFIAHDQLCKFVQVIKFWHVKMSHNLEPRKVAIPPTYLHIWASASRLMRLESALRHPALRPALKHSGTELHGSPSSGTWEVPASTFLFIPVLELTHARQFGI